MRNRVNERNIVGVLLLVAAVASLTQRLAASEARAEEETADRLSPCAIMVDEEVWPVFNWHSFDQDKILSYNGYQYTAYWDADKVLVLVRRNLATDGLQTLRLPDFHLTINPKDAHRNIVLGISPRDGRLHLSWDHHNNDLRYTRSREAFITAPPEQIQVGDIELAQPLTENSPQRVTYPRFFNDPQETLFFIYRSGSSGSGDTVLSRYDAESGTWTIISRRLFSQEGTYEPWDNSSSRNAYFNDVLFDDAGRLHITWVYREVGASWASNHDLHYAYSDDSGLTWRNNAGETIANVAEDDAIELDDPGIVVQEIPVYSWLMNTCAMALDSRNQPHVALYRMPKPFVPEELEHGPRLVAAQQLTFYHYWRTPDGQWHTSGPLEIPERASSGIKRPDIAIGADDTVYIYWPSKLGFRCHIALAEDQWKEWKTFLLTGPEYTSNDASKHDRRLLSEKGILSFGADPFGDENENGFAILDFDLARLLQRLPEREPR